MYRHITRRDFIHDVSIAGFGFSAITGALSADQSGDHGGPRSEDYPPVRTGMRGSHPGSFETAHALAREGVSFDSATDLDEYYDLVIVGGGISGLAAAWFYRQRFGTDSRILVLENHDDFGGHAKRNEFHQGGPMRLAWGGTQNLEYHEFSDTVNHLLDTLGVDIPGLVAHKDFHYGSAGYGPPGIWFDAESYGRDVLVRDFALRFGSREALAEKIGRFPLSESARAALIAF